MKKILSLFCINFIVLGLVACSSSGETTSSEPKEEPKQSEQKEVSNDKKESEVPDVKKDENGNYILDTVGQVVKEPNFATVELMKIKDINETIDIEPIKLTIEDIKLLKLSDMSEEAKLDLEIFTTESLPEEVNYIQIKYSSENTEEKNIDWYGIDKVVLSNGQQLDAISNDFIVNDDDMDSIFYGKVKKEGFVGLIYKGNPEEITSAKIILSDSVDADSYDTITDQQQVEYDLE